MPRGSKAPLFINGIRLHQFSCFVLVATLLSVPQSQHHWRLYAIDICREKSVATRSAAASHVLVATLLSTPQALQHRGLYAIDICREPSVATRSTAASRDATAFRSHQADSRRLAKRTIVALFSRMTLASLLPASRRFDLAWHPQT